MAKRASRLNGSRPPVLSSLLQGGATKAVGIAQPAPETSHHAYCCRLVGLRFAQTGEPSQQSHLRIVKLTKGGIGSGAEYGQLGLDRGIE